MRAIVRGFRFLVILAMGIAIAVPCTLRPAGADGGIEPPPLESNEHLSGPAVVGTMTLDGTNATFVGHCKGNPVNVSIPFPLNIPNVTQTNMEGFKLPNAGPAECFKKNSNGGENMIILTVTKFTPVGNTIVADVVLLYVVNK